jgi:putative N-acetyltransferase (TIGR04045 family)
MQNITIKAARTENEIKQLFLLRKEVFVKEQAIFNNSDRDKLDNISSYLVACVNGAIVGTVRVYPDISNENSWVGGRLAVDKNFRKTTVGKLLVTSAEKFVFNKDAIYFTADIQEQNIAFFKKLDWIPVGDIFILREIPHIKMKANLKKYVKLNDQVLELVWHPDNHCLKQPLEIFKNR